MRFNKQDMKKVYMEIGLTVLLAVFLGIFSARITEGNLVNAKEKQAEQMAAEENQKARERSAENVDSTGAGTSDSTDSAVTEEVIADGQYPIMGTSSVTADQLVAYFNSENKAYPTEALAKGGADSIETFAQIYCEEAAVEGVRAEVAFVQTMKETGWLQFGGDASIEQFNFAGLGTTGNGVPGNSYPDVRTGIRAQIQHLKAYATTETLKGACVDDRYEYVLKGCAPYVEWLGQKENPQGTGWATAENYGYSIVDMINKMKKM